MFRGVNDECAQPQPMSSRRCGAQAQFSAKIIEFPFLRGAEVIVERMEIRTGINHHD
jgi:hypothetical protein